MDFGILIPPVAESCKLVKRAEELGFVRAWFYDTQMLNTELFVAMTAAALNTSGIRLATGVLIPSNRIAPVAACGLASLNALAPGRIDFGISTGFTARRTMGLGQVKQADMEEYIRVVQALLAGETTDCVLEGQRRTIRFLDPDIGAINIKDPIPLHIAASGARGRRLVAKLRAGWIGVAANVAQAQASIAEMQSTWCDAGHDLAGLFATAAVSGCVLRDGEAYDSPRVKALVGANATMLFHAAADLEELPGEPHRPIPPALAPLLERYLAIHRTYAPPDARYLRNHRGHLMYLRPEEEELCTPELVRLATWTAPQTELQERIRELGRAGYQHVALNCGYGHPERLEEWADMLAGV